MVSEILMLLNITCHAWKRRIANLELEKSLKVLVHMREWRPLRALALPFGRSFLLPHVPDLEKVEGAVVRWKRPDIISALIHSQ